MRGGHITTHDKISPRLASWQYFGGAADSVDLCLSPADPCAAAATRVRPHRSKNACRVGCSKTIPRLWLALRKPGKWFITFLLAIKSFMSKVMSHFKIIWIFIAIYLLSNPQYLSKKPKSWLIFIFEATFTLWKMKFCTLTGLRSQHCWYFYRYYLYMN